MRSGELIAAYVFGSVGRGQQDKLSDLDVLVVVKNGSGRVSENLIAQLVPANLRSLKLSISWYGADRLREMFRNGELFAWHLHRESTPLFDPFGFLRGLGLPAPYRECLDDVSSFRSVLAGIPRQVMLSERNATYEAGLVYVCLRNIAMAASWVLCEAPDFSRYSAFSLRGIPPCPISVREFDCAMHCRMASQRGLSPPSGVDAQFVLALSERLDPWLSNLQFVLREQRHGR
jgi:hypothetical protein